MTHQRDTKEKTKILGGLFRNTVDAQLDRDKARADEVLTQAKKQTRGTK